MKYYFDVPLFSTERSLKETLSFLTFYLILVSGSYLLFLRRLTRARQIFQSEPLQVLLIFHLCVCHQFVVLLGPSFWFCCDFCLLELVGGGPGLEDSWHSSVSASCSAYCPPAGGSVAVC